MKSGLDHGKTKVQGVFHSQNRTKMQGNNNYSSKSNQKPSQQHKNIKCGNCGSVKHRSRSSDCPANNKHVIHVDVVDILVTCVVHRAQLNIFFFTS